MGCFPLSKKKTQSELESSATQLTSLEVLPKELSITVGTLVQEISGDPYEQYQEVKLLGEGTFGKVFKVRHKISNAYRAMKVINKPLDIESAEENELIKEIKILKNLDHPNIIKVYEYFVSKRKIFIISELCTGGELFDKISSLRHFNEKNVAHIMKQLLSAIYFCHENGIIHRDIKPENILIETEEEAKKEYFTIKLIDFGTSDTLIKGQMHKKRIGSPFYIAPEVLNNSYNEKCDLWSCGVIMYILLCGSPPFFGETEELIFSAVQKGKLNFDAWEWNFVCDEAKDLIRCLLTRDINKRYSAREALNHDWFRIMKDIIKGPQLESIYMNKIASNLKGFQANQKLQQATLAYIVHNLIKKEDCEKLRQCFIKFDENSDGHLTKEELMNGLLSVMDPIEAREEANRIMEIIDVDKNGYIEYEEFLRASLDKDKILTQENLMTVFRMFDKDNSGKITTEELRQVLGGEEDIEESVWRDMVAEIDANGDGEISFSEFNRMMSKLTDLASKDPSLVGFTATP